MTESGASATPDRADAPERVRAIASYHAHLYWTSPAERERALLVRQWISERFLVQLGTIHDRPIGPHGAPMYQVAFDPDVFAELTPWLMLNRLELSVLIHPNTGRARDDHLVHALWLGPRVTLQADTLPNSLAAGGGVSPVVPNTAPTLA
jgi:aromatic ring-cleaving dioxygenase